MNQSIRPIRRFMLAVAACALLSSTAALAQNATAWEGLYIGGQLGYLSSDVDIDFQDDVSFFRSTAVPEVDGVSGGIYGGYVVSVSDSWIYGLDLEANFVSSDGNSAEAIVDPGNPTPTLGTYNVDISGTLALRGRLGYVFGDNLIYGTAGISYVDYEVDYTSAVTPVLNRSFSQGQVGWTLGIGAERKIGSNWLARLDYKYSDYGRKTIGSSTLLDNNDPPAPLAVFTTNSALDSHEIRLGLARLF